MSVLDFTKSLGLELAGKETLALMKRDLNTEIVAQNASWSQRDIDYGFRPVSIETVPEENFFHGHVPTLIEAPAEGYPNVAVLAFQSQPGRENAAADEHNAYSLTLYIEIMCKSLTDEQELNSRILRTTDAVHAVIMRYPVIGGCYLEDGGAPRVVITDVGHRPATKNHGPSFFYQGSRLEHTLQKYVVLGR